MRVTDSMQSREFTTSLEDIQTRMFNTNAEISSGKKLQHPSQDPAGSARVLRLRDQVSRVNHYFRNIQQARVELASADNALNSLANNVLSVVQRVGLGVNDTSSQTDRNAIAGELDEVLKNILQISASHVDGKMLFSGSAVSTAPVTLVGANYAYQGDDYQKMIAVAENRSVQTNIPGSAIFTAAGSDLVNTVSQLAAAMRASDTSGARQLLGKMDTAAHDIDLARMKLSVSLNQLDNTKIELDQRLLGLTSEISNTEDTNIAQAISQSALNDTALKAALSAGSKLQKSTLFDLLA